VAHDGKEHRVLRNGVVVFRGQEVIHVGFAYHQPVDRIVDAADSLVLPGFVNMHLHAGHAAQGRVISDHGRPEFFGAGYLNYTSPRREGASANQRHADPDLAARITLADLARFGTTTMVEIGAPRAVQEAIASNAADIGLRCYLGPGYRTAETYTDSDGVLRYDWDEERGQQGLEDAIEFIEKFDGAQGGRIKGTLMPMQVDTCSEALLRRTAQVSEELGAPRQIHTAQNLLEFHEMLRRSAMTPVQFLEHCGFLGERASLGHAILTDEHPWTHYAGRDLHLISDSGTSTTHSPLAMMRRGIPMRSFSRYYRSGINICIGTDTYPRDIVSEMRWASLNSKVIDGDVTSGTATEVFNAVTVNGAKALGRDDIGRLAVGSKADIVVVKPDPLRWGPIYDPIRSLVDCGTGEDVEHVFVDGRQVVAGGAVDGVNESELVRECQREADAWYEDFVQHDWKQRRIDEAFPKAFSEASPGEFPDA